ncbi:MAG: ribosome-associated translation inhibitor RaiA [Actinomycetota bacterium]|nr:MAG: ribosome-associated translation inhibitor RaiA [Actinomycetota bacterium]
MQIVVRTRHTDITTGFRQLVIDKVSRSARFGVPFSRIDVEICHERNPRLADLAFRVEITCLGHRPVIRAEADAADRTTALDLALARLDQRLRRAADRRRARRHATPDPVFDPIRPAGVPPAADGYVATPADGVPAAAQSDGGSATALSDGHVAAGNDDVVFATGPVVVREKVHDGGRMTVAQALDALELVGHDFYLFADADCGRPSVVYRRRGYDYGLIRLAVDGSAASESLSTQQAG